MAVTAHASAEDRERCLAMGMDEYLAKPLVLEKLDSILEQITVAESVKT